ncbi:predicted protein [Nematostella vectensis]|uniref:Nudix hydrolase domain-containing protein n=1 Tax=Nematostella vectensis TaxID=45351 RepID=A7SZ60_NEMVE|nr:predicted protein [Nematostella vectensis]|eukprot:XP_001623111.1 predicted protein [Nematostella vectensis]
MLNYCLVKLTRNLRKYNESSLSLKSVILRTRNGAEKFSHWTKRQQLFKERLFLKYDNTKCNSHRLHIRNVSSVLRHLKIQSAVPDEIIENALKEENKERTIKHLQKMKPNKKLIERCKLQAGVLVPFCMVDNKPSVLFTLRSSRLASHSGQVSFPGGKKDDCDVSLVVTAMRETSEELGIDEKQIDIWASLTPISDRVDKYAITAVVGYIGEVDVDSLPFNHHEVSDVFTIPLSEAVRNRRYTKWKTGLIMPVFLSGRYKVWGLTAIMLDRTLDALLTGHYQMVSRFH